VSKVTQEETGADLTIDELAQRVAMTVRNIRAHQSRGLLPPPEVRGRTGYYGPEHVARIELIKELQADGFNLEAIRRLIAGANGSSADVLRFTRALREPFAEDETPEIVTAAELAERWNVNDPALIRKAEKLGILRPLGEGRWEEASPRLARAATELADLGIPAATALDVGSKLRRNADSVSRTFVRLFLEEIWAPFEAAGRPDDQWPQIQEALERLRPLASDALIAVFGMAMAESIDKAFGRELEKVERSGRRRR
jgi:DNA-binding transcriptional MerR regulator